MMAEKPKRPKRLPSLDAGVDAALRGKGIAKKPSPSARFTRGIYLDDESRVKLLELEKQTGKNGSEVIRSLIKAADGAKMARLAALADEMTALLK